MVAGWMDAHMEGKWKEYGKGIGIYYKTSILIIIKTRYFPLYLSLSPIWQRRRERDALLVSLAYLSNTLSPPSGSNSIRTAWNREKERNR